MDLNKIGNLKKSEFLRSVTMRKLGFPKEELLHLSLYLYSYYKCLSKKACTNRLSKGFQIICDYTNYDIIDRNTELRCFANCFSKAFARK